MKDYNNPCNGNNNNNTMKQVNNTIHNITTNVCSYKNNILYKY